MKKLSLILIGLLFLGMPSMASALSLSVSAQVTSGSSLGSYDLLACNGYNYISTGAGSDPWTQAACYDKKTRQTGTAVLTFGGKNGVGPLITKLLDSAGNEGIGADCFYAANFYIVYLYPDAWGGAGYQLSQSFASVSGVGSALVMTPVYSDTDRFCWGPDPLNPCAAGFFAAQGALNTPPYTGEVLGSAVLARSGGSILTARRARIVRAQYGIPPKPGPTGVSGWVAVPLNTAAGTYMASITITLTQI